MTKVFIVSQDEVSSVSKYSRGLNNENEDYSELNLESEKREHEEKSLQRYKKFEFVILNELTEFSWIKLYTVSLMIILSGFVMTTPLTLIPYHDLVQHPEYWFELCFSGTYSGIMGFCFRCITTGSYMNIEYLLLPKNVAKLSLAGCTFILLVWVS